MQRAPMTHVYEEGRCMRCGQRVTVDREHQGHTRSGRWCGPVETEHPNRATDIPLGDRWIVTDGIAAGISTA
jgi:hypothetical protein